MFYDRPGSMTKILSAMEKEKINILMSTSKTLEIGELAEWSAVLDITQARDMKKVEKELKTLDVIKSVEISLK